MSCKSTSYTLSDHGIDYTQSRLSGPKCLKFFMLHNALVVADLKGHHVTDPARAEMEAGRWWH